MNFEIAVKGEYALFSDPLFRMSGEKMSYQIPTYSSLVGLIKNIYWKPAIDIFIDEVRVMNKINLQPMGVKPRHYKDDKNDISIYTYLKDVYYQVRFHIEIAENIPNSSDEIDLNIRKHEEIMKRAIEAGGRHNPFIGTSECVASVYKEKFGTNASYYDNSGVINLGIMLHSIGYLEEPGNRKNSVPVEQRLWDSSMNNGIIIFPSSNSEELYVRKIKTKLNGGYHELDH